MTLSSRFITKCRMHLCRSVHICLYVHGTSLTCKKLVIDYLQGGLFHTYPLVSFAFWTVWIHVLFFNNEIKYCVGQKKCREGVHFVTPSLGPGHVIAPIQSFPAPIPTWHAIRLIKYVVRWPKSAHSFSFVGQYLRLLGFNTGQSCCSPWALPKWHLYPPRPHSSFL